MTREELVKQLFGRLEDETEDVYKYMELCKEAKMIGMHDVAKGLKAIGDEEYTHAKYLAGVLGEELEQPPESAHIWHKWHKMLADVRNK